MNRQTPSPLRDALIDAGCALLSEGGLEALTLRRCAARAGVSHAAPAHHFDGLPGLLAAIGQRGFTLFADAMEHEAACADTPRARLHAICRGYLRFAQNHDALFTLMFSKGRKVAAPDPGLQQAAARAYGILQDVCAPFVPEGVAHEVIEAQVWSLIHGYAFLAVYGQFGPNGGPIGEAAHANAVMALLDQIGEAP